MATIPVAPESQRDADRRCLATDSSSRPTCQTNAIVAMLPRWLRRMELNSDGAMLETRVSWIRALEAPLAWCRC